MKKYIPMLLIMLVVVVAGFSYYSYKKRTELEQRIQAEMAALTQQKQIAFLKDSTSKAQEDLLVLRPGDTTLVSACNKPFFVKRDGIASVAAANENQKDHLTIRNENPSQYEMSFSCEVTKKLELHPVNFTTEQGKTITIYFVPTQDVSEIDSSLRYYSNFEIEF